MAKCIYIAHDVPMHSSSITSANIATSDISPKPDALGYISAVAESMVYLQPSLRYGAPKATEFGKITQNSCHYAVQGHSRSPILVPIESLYAISYLWLILTYLISCSVSEI